MREKVMKMDRRSSEKGGDLDDKDDELLLSDSYQHIDSHTFTHTDRYTPLQL